MGYSGFLLSAAHGSTEKRGSHTPVRFFSAMSSRSNCLRDFPINSSLRVRLPEVGFPITCDLLQNLADAPTADVDHFGNLPLSESHAVKG